MLGASSYFSNVHSYLDERGREKDFSMGTDFKFRVILD